MSDDGYTETPLAERVPDAINQFRLDNARFYAYRRRHHRGGKEFAPGGQDSSEV